MNIRKGNYSIYVAPSKFETKINTQVLAAQAILEGSLLREKIKNKIIFEIDEEE